MTQAVKIEAELRERAGKGTAREVRRTGKTPAVLYGNKQPPVMLSLNTKEIELISRKSGFFTHLFEIKVGKETHTAIARDAQRHPVTENLVHIDFLRIDTKTRLSVAVPVKFINQDKSPGIKRGGMLNIVAHTVDIICSAAAIPEHILVDVEGLEINDSIHASMLQVPEGAELDGLEEEFTVATIAAPSAVRSEIADQAAATAAPAAATAAPAAAAAAAATPDKKGGK